jgi:hypothetical protein
VVDDTYITKIFKNNFHYSGHITIDDLGRVSVSGSVWASAVFSTGVLPVRFLEVERDFDLKIQTPLMSLEGCPETVGKDFRILGASLTSLVGAPKRINGDAVFALGTRSNFKTLEGFPNYVGGVTRIRYTPTLGLLRLLNTHTRIDLTTTMDSGGAMLAAAEIVGDILNRYVGLGKRGAVRCQKELIAAGYEGNARW